MRGSTTFQTGVVALGLAALLFFYAIPTWVSAPGNVPRIVLSPLFWPNILAVAMAMAGAALLLVGWRARRAARLDAADPIDRLRFEPGAVRLALMAALMIVYFFLIPRIGMPFASMVAFVGTAGLMLARGWLMVLISAVVLPLLLYAFFAHVASVAIPQAPFFRLP